MKTVAILRANCCHTASILVVDSCKQICCKWKKTSENIPDYFSFKYGNISLNRESLLLPVILSDTCKEYKEYRAATTSPCTMKPFHTWIRFGGKDRPGFVRMERIDVMCRKARKYISKIEKNKDDKNDNKNNLTVWDTLGWVKE